MVDLSRFKMPRPKLTRTDWNELLDTLAEATGGNYALVNHDHSGVYQPAGSYAASVHGHAIADVTGLQAALDNAGGGTHTHAISEVAGLQSALDGKQASGSYAASAHGHIIGDVTGLQAALDGKQASGSYSLTSHNHDAAYAPLSHTQAISTVIGLQAALDGKQAAGSYAAASHNHDGVYALADHTHPGGGSDPWTWAMLTADRVNTTTTLAAATDLSFTALANTTYVVELIGAFTSSLTTAGIACALDIPSGQVVGQGYAPISATASGAFEQIADNATTGATASVRAANTLVPVGAQWIVAVGATGGTVQLTFRPEVAATCTLKANLTTLRSRAI